MQNRKITTLKVIFFTSILLTAIFTGCIQQEKVEEEEETFSIQQLINAASPGDTIIIPSGTHYENIIVDKPLTLIGDNKDDTIIDGMGGQQVIHVTADNVQISGLTIRNSGGHLDNAGIKIDSDNNLVKNCKIYRTKTGIYFNKVENNVVSNCFFHTNGEGIYYYYSLGNSIDNSQFHHNAFGLHLFNSEGAIIRNSYIHTNGLGIYGKDSRDVEINQCSICDNNQDGGGVWLFGCSNFKFSDCNINHNGVGLKLKNSDAEISFCNLYQNMYNAFLLESSNDVVVSNCDIKDSMRTAFYIKESQCVFYDNNIVGSNLFGLECDRNSNCDVRNNWWGSKSGPSLTEPGSGEKISLKPKSLKLYPWKKKLIDEVGASWSTKEVFTKLEVSSDRFKPILFEEKDTDLDGVPDWWEEKWGYNSKKWEDHYGLDPDYDALNNVEECYTDSYGSNPFSKDIFIEVDWIKSKDTDVSNKVSFDFIEEAKMVFEEHGINLHIDTGNLGGGEEISVDSVSSCVDFRDIYWDYFLKNDLDNPRKGIFHYALVADYIKELYGGFVFVGWGHLDAIGIAIQKRVENNPMLFGRDRLIINGILHELGHSMGLLIDDHGGIDNHGSAMYFTVQAMKFRNYKSIMNYRYRNTILDYSDGSQGYGDFDDWSNLDFSFFKNTHLEWSKG